MVDGVEIPTDELQLTPEIGLVEFTPAGQAVEALDTGQNCVTAVIWRSQDGRGVDDRPIPWCFDGCSRVGGPVVAGAGPVATAPPQAGSSPVSSR